MFLNANQFLSIDNSKKFYTKNINYYLYLYKPFNNINKKFFKNKIKSFFLKSEPYLKYIDIEKRLLKNKLINAIANEEYKVNHLNHYSFYIDGNHYIYGVVEIFSLIKKGMEIRNSLKVNNVIQFKK